jgi:hypothetical protein
MKSCMEIEVKYINAFCMKYSVHMFIIRDERRHETLKLYLTNVT